MLRSTIVLTLLAVVLGSGGVQSEAPKKMEHGITHPLVQTLYFGGDIVSMEGDEATYVEAVMERDGKIIYAGKRSGAVNNFAGKTIEVDLKHKTMLPGFIEPHAHPVSIGAFILANDIVAPHEWRMPHKTYPGVSGKENYLQAVKDIIESKEDETKTVLIWGYHKSWHGSYLDHDVEQWTHRHDRTGISNQYFRG